MCQLIPRCGVREKDGDDNDDKNNDDNNDDDNSINDNNNDNSNKNNIRQISSQSNESSGKNRNTNNRNVRRNSNHVNDTTNASPLSTNVSGSSNVISLSSSLLAKEQNQSHNQSTEQITASTGISSMTPTQSHQQAIVAMIAARKQRLEAAISNNFLLMGTTTSQNLQLKKYQQEQQQIRVQQFEQQRIQQFLNHQEAASAMTVLRTAHSYTTPSSSSIARQVITPETSTAKVPEESNKSKLDALFEQEKISILRNEFQFPWKLFEMLERSETDEFSHLVGWMPGDTSTCFTEGACFKVHDTDNFVKKVMPIFFKQTKYKSFQRQLNLYSFLRIDAGPNKGAYRHPSFLRGRKDMLPSIQRIKIKGKGKLEMGKSNTNKYNRHNLKVMSSLKGQDQDVDDASSVLPSASARKYSSIAHRQVGASVPVPSQYIESGIDVILQAIKARERTDNNCTRANCNANTGNDIHYVGDSSSDSDSITF